MCVCVCVDLKYMSVGYVCCCDGDKFCQTDEKITTSYNITTTTTE